MQPTQDAAIAPSASLLATDDGRDGGPPLTDRGVLTPVPNSLTGHIDYLKVTVWGDLTLQLKLLTEWLMNWVEEPGFGPTEWTDEGPARRIKSRWTWRGWLTVLEYADCDWASVELKGHACSLLSIQQIETFMIQLRRLGSARCSRIDYAWDGVPFTVHDVRDAIDRGDWRSRCKLTRSEFYQSETGCTVYFPRARCDRFLRVYDKRGPVRLELQLGAEHAAAAFDQLGLLHPDAWSGYMLSRLRGLVDFVDATSSTRIERTTLLPWWSEFVGNAEVCRSLPPHDPREVTVGAQVSSGFRRCARFLWRVREVFGIEAEAAFNDALNAGLDRWALDRDLTEDRKWVDLASSWRGLIQRSFGVRLGRGAGVDELPDDFEIPF